MYMYVLPKIFKYLWNIEGRDKCFEFGRNGKCKICKKFTLNL